jgi:hypothetical protein
LEAVELQTKIDKIARDIERGYSETLRKMRKLKGMLNALEQTLSQEKSSKTTSHMKALNSAAESLSRLSDSLLIQSKKAWQTHTKLQCSCKTSGLELTHLDKVRILCMKTEGMATDLLCYSLGYSKQRMVSAPSTR